jgi:hypothetical protein
LINGTHIYEELIHVADKKISQILTLKLRCQKNGVYPGWVINIMKTILKESCRHYSIKMIVMFVDALRGVIPCLANKLSGDGCPHGLDHGEEASLSFRLLSQD